MFSKKFENEKGEGGYGLHSQADAHEIDATNLVF